MAAMLRVLPDLSDFRLKNLIRITSTTEIMVSWSALWFVKTEIALEWTTCVWKISLVLTERSGVVRLAGHVVKKCSIRKDSFFSASHLSIENILILAYLWAFEVDKQYFLMRELDLSNKSVVDWKQFCRDICHDYFILNPVQLGDTSWKSTKAVLSVESIIEDT